MPIAELFVQLMDFTINTLLIGERLGWHCAWFGCRC
jgi:hypothetical protein